MAGEITCTQFADALIRRTEHLDEDLLRDITPTSTLIGMVETGRFPAENGVEHTFDKLNRVWPDMSTAWEDVAGEHCVGQPCDPTETKICMGWTRDSYKLQRKSYASDLLCWDLILTADRAKAQFAQYVEVLRDATNIINSNRLRNEYFRNCGNAWLCMLNGLEAFTFTETGDLINVTATGATTGAHLPTSKLVVNMLKRRIQNQILVGALGKIAKGTPPEIEVVTDMDTIWDLIQGDSALTDHWRFQDFPIGSKEYNQYGWTGRVGNFMLHADLHPIRFQINGNVLSRVFPYENAAATGGIRGLVNEEYLSAPVQATFIWHRRAIKSLVRDTTSIHPMMPFAARDFGGKWQFVMDNLTCGTAVDANGLVIPVAVDNSRRNKGKFIADFEYATQPQFPEYAEVFLHLREQPCVVGVPTCATYPDYVVQNFESDCETCEEVAQ